MGQLSRGCRWGGGREFGWRFAGQWWAGWRFVAASGVCRAAVGFASRGGERGSLCGQGCLGAGRDGRPPLQLGSDRPGARVPPLPARVRPPWSTGSAPRGGVRPPWSAGLAPSERGFCRGSAGGRCRNRGSPIARTGFARPYCQQSDNFACIRAQIARACWALVSYARGACLCNQGRFGAWTLGP